MPVAFLEPIRDFDGARAHSAPANRRRAILRASAAFRERMISRPPVPYYGSFDLVRVPYPTRFALREACRVPTPFVHIINRLFIIQFQCGGSLRTLLVSPSDVEAARETPFFKRLATTGAGRWLPERLLAPRLGSVEEALARAGIAPEQVDYLTYDHLHTQDLRRWLGSEDRPGYFPNAKLLVTWQEWASAHALLPPQNDWYCPNGLARVPASRVVFLEGDARLGEGVALIRTPGHTEGNHSIVVRTEEGIFVSSENGVSADSYAPLASRIPGVRAYAKATGMEVVLNGNTLEGSIDQYLSMLQEREIAGRSRRNPDSYDVVPSSELASYWLFPGVRPTFRFGAVQLGRPWILGTSGGGRTGP